MSAIEIKVNEGELHPNTQQIIVIVDGAFTGFTELDAQGNSLVTHHVYQFAKGYKVKMPILYSNNLAPRATTTLPAASSSAVPGDFSCNAQAVAKCDERSMRELIANLEKAATSAVEVPDAKAIVTALKKAEDKVGSQHGGVFIDHLTVMSLISMINQYAPSNLAKEWAAYFAT